MTNVIDPGLVPAYLSKYKLQIKAHSILILDCHLREINNPAGYGGNISTEDYGITFRWTTVSELGAKLCPTEWREGPLY